MAADDTITNERTELEMLVLFPRIESRRWGKAEVAFLCFQRSIGSGHGLPDPANEICTMLNTV